MGIRASYLAIVATVAGVGCAGRGLYANRATEVMFRSAVRVRVACFDGRGGEARGVAVSATSVLTVRHVLDACRGDEPALVLANGREMIMDGTPSHTDTVRLVAVEGRRPFRVWAEPAPPPSLGDEVCAVAGDPSVPRLMKCGRVSARGPDWVLVGIRTVPGESGSPLFAADGRLVGLLKSRASGSEQEAAVAVTGPGWRRVIASARREPVPVDLEGDWP